MEARFDGLCVSYFPLHCGLTQQKIHIVFSSIKLLLGLIHPKHKGVITMKLPLLAMVAALFLGGCSNTWEGVKDDSSEIYNESKETVHEATE